MPVHLTEASSIPVTQIQTSDLQTFTPATATEISNSTQINFIGDSLIDLSPGWTSPVLQFKAVTGLKGYNLGVSGTTTTQIKAKFDALVVTNPSLLSQSWVFEGGRNDISQNGTITATANLIKSNIAAMIASLATVGNTRYLVLGIVNSNSETTVSTSGIFVNQLNADLASLYGAKFVPMLAALQAGGDGSANDNADIAAGIVPRSKMYDTIHPNTAGAAIETQQIINKIALLVPNQSRYLTIGSVGGVLQANQINLSLGVGGGISIGDIQILKLPDQDNTKFYNTVIIGNGAKNLSHTTGSTGQGNTIIGMLAGNGLTTGSSNTLIGNYAGYNVSTGDLTAVGESAGLGNTTGGDNVYFGKSAGRSVTTGSTNIILGSNSGKGINTGSQNIAMGLNSSFANAAGNGNVAIGVSSQQNLTGGSNNTALGTQALKGTSNTTSNNVAIGTDAGLAVTTGANNILVGYKAGEILTSGSKNIILAYDGDTASNTASNQINIGNVIWGQGASGTGTTKAGTLGIAIDATTTATLTLPASTTTVAPINIAAGTAPTTPQNGDMWTEGTDLKIRLGGTTYTITKI